MDVLGSPLWISTTNAIVFTNGHWWVPLSGATKRKEFFRLKTALP